MKKNKQDKDVILDRKVKRVRHMSTDLTEVKEYHETSGRKHS